MKILIIGATRGIGLFLFPGSAWDHMCRDSASKKLPRTYYPFYPAR